MKRVIYLFYIFGHNSSSFFTPAGTKRILFYNLNIAYVKARYHATETALIKQKFIITSKVDCDKVLTYK